MHACLPVVVQMYLWKTLITPIQLLPNLLCFKYFRKQSRFFDKNNCQLLKHLSRILKFVAGATLSIGLKIVCYYKK